MPRKRKPICELPSPETLAAIREAADLFAPTLKRMARGQSLPNTNEARCPVCDALAKRGRCPEHGSIAPLWEAYARGYADALALG